MRGVGRANALKPAAPLGTSTLKQGMDLAKIWHGFGQVLVFSGKRGIAD